MWRSDLQGVAEICNLANLEPCWRKDAAMVSLSLCQCYSTNHWTSLVLRSWGLSSVLYEHSTIKNSTRRRFLQRQDRNITWWYLNLSSSVSAVSWQDARHLSQNMHASLKDSSWTAFKWKVILSTSLSKPNGALQTNCTRRCGHDLMVLVHQ